MSEPLTIAKIKEMRTPQAVVAAVKQYDQQIKERQTEAHRLRDRAILELLNTNTVSEVARLVGMSVSHVKLVKLIGDRS